MLVLAGFWIVERWQQQQFRQDHRADVLAQLSIMGARLEGALNKRLFLTRGLVAYLSNYPDIDRVEFERVARVIVAELPGIEKIQLAKNTTISHIYPRSGYEADLGVNLLESPEDEEATQKAIATRKTVLVGPVINASGDLAWIARIPIFQTPQDGKLESGPYWGLMQVFISTDALLKEAAFFEPRDELQYALRIDNMAEGEFLLFGQETVFQADPVTFEVSLQGRSWELGAIPVEPEPSTSELLVILGGWLLAGLTGILVFQWARSPARLAEAVERATGELRQSEAKYRELVQNANTIILRMDVEGNIVFFNEFAQSFFGYSESEIIGKNALGTIMEESYSSGNDLLAMVKQSLESPEQYTYYESDLVRRQGKKVWVAWRNKALRDEGGNFRGILCIGADISDRKLAEQELQERVEFENLITTISTRLIDLDVSEIDKEIDQALQVLGEFAEVDRSYIFQFSENLTRFDNTHEWCVAGVEPQKDNLQGLSIEDLPWFYDTIKNLEVMEISRVSELPPEASAEKESLQSQEIQSLICVPMISAGSLVGFLGFDSVRAEKSWSPESIKILKMVGEMFVNALERQRVEVALRDSEAELRALFAAMSDIIIVLDKEGSYLKIAPTNPNLLYKPSSDLLGKTLHEVIPKAGADKFLAEIRRSLDTKQTRSFEYSLDIDDREVWFFANISPIQEDSVLWVARDITDLKQAELALQKAKDELEIRVEERTADLMQANQQLRKEIADRLLAEEELRKSEERWQLALKGNNDGIWDWNLITNECFYSARCKEMLGYADVEIWNHIDELLSRIHPEDMGSVMDDLQKHLKKITPYFVADYRMRCRDGSYKWILSRAQALWDEAGIPVRAVGSITDITERKQAEEALRQSEMREREKAGQLEEALREIQRSQAQMIQSEKMSSLGQLVAGIAHEINNPVNFIHGNLGYVTDYTQELLNLVHLYADEYSEASLDIREKLEEIDLDFLEEDLGKMIDSMRRGTERISQIVLSLRNFSRLDEAEMKPVDIHEGIESTLLILQNRLNGSQGLPEIKVVKEFGKLPEIVCYASQLNQVFMNIISNAIDAIEMRTQQLSAEEVGSNPGIITISTARVKRRAMAGEDNVTQRSQRFSPTRKDGEIDDSTASPELDWVAVEITDNGLGIDEEIISQIFNPFFTTKDVGQGKGLGLSVSYQIVVEQHGGELNCKSQPGRLTTFEILIPVIGN